MAFRGLGFPARRLAPRSERMPGREGRVLGADRGEASLHPLRDLSLRAALEAGAFDRDPRRPMGPDGLASPRMASLAAGPAGNRDPDVGRGARASVRRE